MTEETTQKPTVICTRILRWKDCFIYDSKNVISMERYRIWKSQKHLRKELAEAEFLRMCREWHQ